MVLNAKHPKHILDGLNPKEYVRLRQLMTMLILRVKETDALSGKRLVNRLTFWNVGEAIDHIQDTGLDAEDVNVVFLDWWDGIPSISKKELKAIHVQLTHEKLLQMLEIMFWREVTGKSHGTLKIVESRKKRLRRRIPEGYHCTPTTIATGVRNRWNQTNQWRQENE